MLRHGAVFFIEFQVLLTFILFPEAGAWKYVEQNRHAYFKKMQVFFLSNS